jgi:diguanylate cyclase (GGDEF)-like protein
MVAAAIAFATFIIAFRYLNLLTRQARWKLVLETWAMIVLTALVVWHTGKSQSPLINLYLLPIVFSAVTLGKTTTSLQVLLIVSLYLHAAHAVLGEAFFSYDTFSHALFDIAPFVLVAYITALLSADMIAARNFIKQLSETDDLTGLPNMRAFGRAVRREKARSEREKSQFSIVMMDADNMKSINDRFGHEAGNELMRHMAGAIQRILRASDMVARYGGDEFVVLLPNTGPEEARQTAERLRSSIANMSFDAGGAGVGTTASVGYATYPDTARELDILLAQADHAMYASKEAGRDRVSGVPL